MDGVTLAPSDVDSLIRMTASEGGNEPPDAQAAIASTALNRAQLTGKSVSSLASDPSIYNGSGTSRYNLSPDSPTYQAVAANITPILQNGPSTNATHFYAPKLMATPPSWAKGQQGQQIGSQMFYSRPQDFAQAAPSTDELREAYLQQQGVRGVTPQPGGAVRDPATGETFSPDGKGGYVNAQGQPYQVTTNETPGVDELRQAYLASHPQGAPSAPPQGATVASVAGQAGRGLTESALGVLSGLSDTFANPSNALFKNYNLADSFLGNWLPQAPVQPNIADALRQPIQPLLNQQPQNALERIGRLGGQLLPAAAVGPEADVGVLGQALSRAGNVALPLATGGASGEAAAALGANPQQIGLAQTIGSLPGGLAAGAMAPKGGSGQLLAGINPETPVSPLVAAKAAQYVAGKAGATDQTMIDAAQSGKPVMLAEMLGAPGKVALKAAAIKSPAVSGDLSQTLADRGEGIQQNYADAYGKAAGVTPEAAKGDFDTQITQARANMRPQYQAVLASPEPVMTPALAEISQRPAVQSAIKLAATSLRNAGKDPAALGIKLDPVTGEPVMGAPATQMPAGVPEGATPAIRAQIAEKMGVSAPAPEPVTQSQPTLEAWDLTKKAMQDQVKRDPFGRVITTGQEGRFNADTNTAARDLTGALREASPEYGQVLDQAGDYMRQQQAFELGQKHLFDPKTSVADGQDYFGNLSSPEQDAYRAGQANAVFDKAQKGLLTAKSLSPPIVKGKLDYAIPGGADDFLTDVKHYDQMRANGSFVAPTTGTQTQPLLAESEAQEKASAGPLAHAIAGMGGDFARGALIGGLEGGPHGALAAGSALAASRLIGPLAKGAQSMISNAAVSPEVREEIGRLLMSHMTPDELQTYASSLKGTPGADFGSRTAVPLSKSIFAGYLASPGVGNTNNALSGVQ